MGNNEGRDDGDVQNTNCQNILINAPFCKKGPGGGRKSVYWPLPRDEHDTIPTVDADAPITPEEIARLREAYDRAKTAGDQERMFQLDASFQREQLLLEALLDIRDALHAIADAPSSTSALEKLDALRRLTRLR